MSKFKNQNFNFSNFRPQHPAAHGIVLSRKFSKKRTQTDKFYELQLANKALIICERNPKKALALLLIKKWTFSDINFHCLKTLLTKLRFVKPIIDSKYHKKWNEIVGKLLSSHSEIANFSIVLNDTFTGYAVWSYLDNHSINHILSDYEKFKNTGELPNLYK